MSLCRWRRHGCIKSYPLTKKLWKKIWKIENIPGMLWQLHKSKYIRFKNIHFSFKKSFQFNIVSYKSFDPIWNHFHYYPWEKIRSSPWAHGDILMSSLWVHSDQNAESWPSREFTVIKMLRHRDNLFSREISTQIWFYMHTLLLHAELTLTIWLKKIHLPQIQSD